jgi:hypothetical protein
MLGEAFDPEKALFVRSVALQICPDGIWPLRNIPKFVRIPDPALFPLKKFPDLA